MNGQTVAGGVTDGLHFREVLFLEPRIEIGYLHEGVGLVFVVVIQPSGHAVRTDGNEHALFVFRHVADADAQIGELGLKLVVKGLGFRVEVDAVQLVGVVGGAEQFFAQVGPDDAADAGFVALVDQFLFAGGGVVSNSAPLSRPMSEMT